MQQFFIAAIMAFMMLLTVNSIITNTPTESGVDIRGSTEYLSYSEFITRVNDGLILEAIVKSDGTIISKDSSNQRFTTRSVGDPDLITRLVDNKVKFEVERPSGLATLLSTLFFSLLPVLLILGFWFFMMKNMQGGRGGLGGFGKSKHRLLTQVDGKVLFDDVAGVDEAKEDLQETVDFLRNPGKFHTLGGKMPKGLLMVGPPGTGKTMLARAVAGEAGVPFFTISGSDFVEMFVGVGAARVRDLFTEAKKNAPCIVFIDEIDAVGRHRGAGVGGGNDEREQTLNQILVEMDGFETNEGIVIIGATNRPDVLDPALVRPGRFDRQVVVSHPDLKGREAILRVHARKIKLSPNVDLVRVARGTPGFSGADLANLVNEAALMAARRNNKLVTAEDFDLAKDKIMMGPERRSMIISEEEKKLTAYHEAGHAIIAKYTPSSDPIHKATIIPRGRALGMVIRLPERDRVSYSREQMVGNIAMAMGGRVAEEEVFGYDKVTAGASSDIQQVTDIARRMVMQWGMSDELGTISYGGNEQELFLGRAVTETKKISEETAQKIDREIKRLVDEGYAQARKIIKEHWEEFVRIAEGLLEYETLSGEEIDIIMRGEKLPTQEEKYAETVKPVTGISSIPKTGKPKLAT